MKAGQLSALKRAIASKKAMLSILFVLIAACATAAINSVKDGMVEFAGKQDSVFETGKADPIMSLNSLKGKKGLYAVGPVDGLDGEITIFDSKPYITKVRGADYDVDHSLKHGAIFLVWTEQTAWRDIAVPADIQGYIDLQNFVKSQAAASCIDVNKPFPFLISGTADEIKWHINVDKTDGHAITKELFAKSKAGYVAKGERVDIIGFYSERHLGVFISKHAPAIKPDNGARNAVHMHLVSRDGKAAGHVDDLTLGGNMVLRLPQM